MKTNFFSLLIACFVVTSIFSQSNLNDYKYIIVPKKFDFLKVENQYKLNGLTDFLFKKYGFQTLIEGDNYPSDLVINRCLALRSDVLKDSGMFKTKLNVVLKDCNDQVVYTSSVGESREKDYKKAYNLALRSAFKSLEALNYSYVPNENNTVVASQTKETNNAVTNEIEKLKEEIKNLKEEKVEVVETKHVVKEVSEIPVVKIKEKAKSVIVKKESENILYAQAISKGFQLVDSSPKVVMILHRTALEDVFIVKDKNAIVFKQDGAWYYCENDTALGLLNLKF